MSSGVRVTLSNDDKLLIHVPLFSRQDPRLRIVVSAATRVAEMLGAAIEIRRRRDVLSVWVYYAKNGKERVPVYFDWGKNWSDNDVFHAIRGTIHGLSLHAEHTLRKPLEINTIEW